MIGLGNYETSLRARVRCFVVTGGHKGIFRVRVRVRVRVRLVIVRVRVRVINLGLDNVSATC